MSFVMSAEQLYEMAKQARFIGATAVRMEAQPRLSGDSPSGKVDDLRVGFYNPTLGWSDKWDERIIQPGGGVHRPNANRRWSV